MSSEITLCAVVVTYNRKKLLIECLEALENQSRPLDAIYIVDNASTDGTPELLLEKGYLRELPEFELKENFEKTLKKGNVIIHYLKMHENTGGAGGFHEGVKNAYKKGYDWIWIMDDDTEPEKKSLKLLCEHLNEKNSVLCGTVKDPTGQIQTSNRGSYVNLKDDPTKGFYLSLRDPKRLEPLSKEDYKKKYMEIDFASFVGVLINRKAVDKIGYPKKEFFIYHDDVEYSIRLRETGKIALITDSVILHKKMKIKEVTEKKFLGKKVFSLPFDKYWITYYRIRNETWLQKRYSTNFIYFYLKVLNSYCRKCLHIILVDDNKIKRLKIVTNAHYDGLKGIFDNSKPKMILYAK